MGELRVENGKVVFDGNGIITLDGEVIIKIGPVEIQLKGSKPKPEEHSDRKPD